jgi:hypothetical protein
MLKKLLLPVLFLVCYAGKYFGQKHIKPPE